MATVGWQRISAFDSKFLYSGTWNSYSASPYYNGHEMATAELNAKVTFKFRGTQLRIITDANTDHTNNIQITIDGQIDNFSVCSSAAYQRVSYEKSGLSSQIHTVELVNLENKVVGFNAVDIDDTGELIAFSIVESPTNLTAVAGDSKVTLSWTAVDGATGYNVKRSTTAGGPYTTIASNVTGTSYVDTSVTNGTTYYYVVTALNADGESKNSNEASATPEGMILLRITMNDSSEREYQVTSSEADKFIAWCNRTVDTGTAYYVFDKVVGSQTSKEYLFFEKIISFEVFKL